MNGKAAVKAAGSYLGIMAAVTGWIVGLVFAGLSRNEGWIYVASFWPILLLFAALFLYWGAIEPIVALYRHFNRKGDK